MPASVDAARLHVTSRGAPMRAALDDEIARLELLIARVWQALAAAGCIGASIVGATLAVSLGWALAAVSLAFLGWFTLVRHLLKRQAGRRLRLWVVPAVEGTLPWVFLAVVLVTQGPAHALGSWLPPLLYAALMVASMVRLRPVAPVILGVTAGAAFLVVYFTLLRPRLDPALLEQPFYGAKLQVVRSMALAFGGLFVAVVSKGLLAAIGRAQRVVRARDLFGKYRIERKIASGGMGIVYAATYCPEGGFERPVAVKVIHDHLAEQPQFVASFRNEAELTARLVHANIVQVFDFGRVEETYFLAMEYVDGLTLRALLKRMAHAHRRMPLHVAAWLGHEILAGLSYAHTGARDAEGRLLRVVHRDLSPANILLSRNGEVKISDYGVARALREARAATTTTLAGHFAYMAPEQAVAAPTDERADLFVAAIVLWEVLCGRPLFHRPEDAATLQAVISDVVPPPSLVRDDADRAWERFFERAMERDARLRFQSATEMALALAAFAPRTACTEELAALVVWALADPPADTGIPITDSDELPTRVEG